MAVPAGVDGTERLVHDGNLQTTHQARGRSQIQFIAQPSKVSLRAHDEILVLQSIEPQTRAARVRKRHNPVASVPSHGGANRLIEPQASQKPADCQPANGYHHLWTDQG